jgi:hypothetical protein
VQLIEMDVIGPHIFIKSLIKHALVAASQKDSQEEQEAQPEQWGFLGFAGDSPTIISSEVAVNEKGDVGKDYPIENGANNLWERDQGLPPAGTPVPLPPALPSRNFCSSCS